MTVILKKVSTKEAAWLLVIVEKVLLEWNYVSMCPSPSLQSLHIACLDSKSTSFCSFCLPLAYYFAMHQVASRQLNCFFTLCKPFNFSGILQKLSSLWTQWPKWHHFPHKVQQGTILVVKLKGKNVSPVTYGCRGTGRRKWFVKLYLQWSSEVKNGQGLQILIQNLVRKTDKGYSLSFWCNPHFPPPPPWFPFYTLSS